MSKNEISVLPCQSCPLIYTCARKLRCFPRTPSWSGRSRIQRVRCTGRLLLEGVRIKWSPLSLLHNFGFFHNVLPLLRHRNGTTMPVSEPWVRPSEAVDICPTFPYLVFLALLESLFVLPAKNRIARRAVDVCYRVEPCDKHSIFPGPQGDVHHVGEQVGASVTTLERFRHHVLMVCSMKAAVHARVDPRAIQMLSEDSSHVFGNPSLNENMEIHLADTTASLLFPRSGCPCLCCPA